MEGCSLSGDLVFPAAAMDPVEVSHLTHCSPSSLVPILVKPEQQCDDPAVGWLLEVVEETQGGGGFSPNFLEEFVPVSGSDFDQCPTQGLRWPIANQILFKPEALPGLDADTPQLPKNEVVDFPRGGSIDDLATSSSGSVAEDQCCEFDHQLLASAATSRQILGSLGVSWFEDDRDEGLETVLRSGMGPPRKLQRIEEDRSVEGKNSDDGEVEVIDPDQHGDQPEKQRGASTRNSIDPQSMAARRRRKRISDRVRCLEKLIPGGSKMDTAGMLEEAIHYVKFLQLQVELLESIGDRVDDHQKSMKTPQSPLVLSEELQEALFRNRCCVTAINR